MNQRIIVGYGYAKAEHCIHNDDLSKVVDTNDEWITTRTGIKTRYVSEHEWTSDLGYRAAENAIANAGMDRNEIDLIIVATMTPDHITPSTACLIQEKLGCNGNHVMAFDINAACSGFLYAMQTAALLLEEYQCALIIGAETLSRIIDWQDRNTCVLFGDGAGAIIMKRCENQKNMHFFAQSIGDCKGILKAEGPHPHAPLVNGVNQYGYLHMDGSEVFRFALSAMEYAIHKVIEKAGISLEEVDLIIPHQANIRIIKSVARRMKMREDQFFVNLNEFGNTSAASVAIALAQALEQGKAKKGMKIVLVGFGAGFTYASAYIEL